MRVTTPGNFAVSWASWSLVRNTLETVRYARAAPLPVVHTFSCIVGSSVREAWSIGNIA